MVPDVVRRFFDTYRDAFVRFDGAGVAASYHAPSILARGDSYVLWATPAEVRANCDALVDAYRDRGTWRADYEISGFRAQGPHFAVVTLDWTVYSRQAEAPLSFHATYNLFERAGTWRILVATVFD
jgi:hypothetical protein